jgi:glucose/arabinose dehydrogenase
MKTVVRISVLIFSISALAFPSQGNPPLKLRMVKIASGFTSPVGMASPADGTNRLFIIEQGGKIKIIKKGKVLPVPFLNVSSKLDGLNIAYSEKGLLGMAFHPQYKTNGRFFIYYSAPIKASGYDHKSVIAEYKVSANADIADASSETIIMEIAQPESNHNGGCMAFGKDGMLYIGLGDGGGAGDKHGSIGHGQDLTTLLGSIIRLDVDGKKPYSIPADNPFVNHPHARPEIYAYGLRNPWRFSFDRTTGRLFCSDVGQNKFEETNLIEKGKNYGWRIMEGNHCFNPPQECNTSGMTMPIDEYDHNVGISVCGGYVYRGLLFPSLHGYYLFGDWNGKLFYLKEENKRWVRGDILVNGNSKNDIDARLNSFGEDENGEVYVITQKLFGPKSPTGAVYRLGL